MSFELRFPTGRIDWVELKESTEPDYPIDYKMAVLGYDLEHGTLDMLVEFAPNSYCHFHRHMAHTTTLVLRGEQHLYEVLDDGQMIHKVRKAGEYARAPGGEAHRECGGPEGALVYFTFQQEGGPLFDLLDPAGKVVAKSTIEELAASQQAA
jgi:hypothetical protein